MRRVNRLQRADHVADQLRLVTAQSGQFRPARAFTRIAVPEHLFCRLGASAIACRPDALQEMHPRLLGDRRTLARSSLVNDGRNIKRFAPSGAKRCWSI